MELYVARNLIQRNVKDGHKAEIQAVVPIYEKNDFTLQNTFFDPSKKYGIIYEVTCPKGDCQGDSVLEFENSTKLIDIYRCDGRADDMIVILYVRQKSEPDKGQELAGLILIRLERFRLRLGAWTLPV